MMCHLLLSCSVLLMSCAHLIAHPITDTEDMAYTGPDSVEEVVSPDDFSVSDLGDVLQRAAAGAGHSPLISRENIKMAGEIPKEALKDLKEIISYRFLLDKPSRLVPPSALWAVRRQFRKRGGGADCFWKYCV